MWKSFSKEEFKDFLSNLKERKPNEKINVIKAFKLIKDKGAFILLNSQEDAEKLFLSDICVIFGDVFCDSYELLLNEDFSQACFVTAESKTADIEKKLVSGVHGPKECYFVILQ